MVAISHTIFFDAYSCMKGFVFSFHLSLFLKYQLTKISSGGGGGGGVCVCVCMGVGWGLIPIMSNAEKCEASEVKLSI